MSNRTEKKQDWRSGDAELKSGSANAKKASDVSTDKRTTDKPKDNATDTKSRSADSMKNRDQRR